MPGSQPEGWGYSDLTLSERVSSCHFRFPTFSNPFLLKDRLEPCLDVIEGPEFVIRNILFLTVADQPAFGKDDICVADGTPIGDAIPDIHDDIVVPRKRQQMIAFAVAAHEALSICVGERRDQFRYCALLHQLKVVGKKR
jgi:hypothetical protein